MKAKQECTKAKPVIYIGKFNPVYKITPEKIKFEDMTTAKTAWLMLAEMGIEAFLDHGIDGYLSTTETTAWKKQTGIADYKVIPDISLKNNIDDGNLCSVTITSQCMQCDYTVSHAVLDKHIKEIIIEWRDLVDAGMV